jgi:hypothetical protein
MKAIVLTSTSPLCFKTYSYMVQYLLETYAVDYELPRAYITSWKRLPCLARGSGPNMSIATDSRGPLAGNNFNGFVTSSPECGFSRKPSTF